MFEGILSLVEHIVETLHFIVTLMQNGIKIVNSFITLPTDSLSVFISFQDFLPAVIWIPVLVITILCILLRIWNVITSGGR